MILKKMSLFAALALFFGAAACNTVEGMGQDVEATGEAIEEEANDAKN